jgi:hypothetical protein
VPHEEQRSEAAVLTRDPRPRRRKRAAPHGSSLRLVSPAAPSAGRLPLERVQRWLQAVIVHPGAVGDAIASDAAAREVSPERLADLIRPSHSLTPTERVEIYHDMYLLRMIEALEADYPAVRHFLGEDAFVELVEDYVQAHPSRSYTLNRLGDHLPEFLRQSTERAHAAFLHDLACLELAITEVFDEEESAVLAPEQVRAVPEERWPGARLRPVRAFRLLTFEHPVLRWLDAAHRKASAPEPVRRSSRVAVYRHRYSVLRLELSRPEHALLAALAGGAPLAEAVAAASAIRERRREREVFTAFRTWIAEGMFSSVDL